MVHMNLSALEKLRKAHVNSACIGCGACVSVSPRVFDLNDDGKSIVMNLESCEGQGVDDAISACPVSAISWQPCGPDGKYLDGLREHQDPKK